MPSIKKTISIRLFKENDRWITNCNHINCNSNGDVESITTIFRYNGNYINARLNKKLESDTMNDSKIIAEIIPEDGENVNELRKRIHTLINSARKGCKRVRIWAVNIRNNKNDKK